MPTNRPEYMKVWRQTHQEQIRTYQKAYRQTHKAKAQTYERDYRHREAGHLDYLAHKPQRLETQKTYRQTLKIQAFQAYGGSCCLCCGETHVEFLTIDHVNGGGSVQRQALKVGGWNFYGWLRKQGYPPGFRVLCMNCNFSLGKFDYCPHKNPNLNGVTPKTPGHTQLLLLSPEDQ